MLIRGIAKSCATAAGAMPSTNATSDAPRRALLNPRSRRMRVECEPAQALARAREQRMERGVGCPGLDGRLGEASEVRGIGLLGDRGLRRGQRQRSALRLGRRPRAEPAEQADALGGDADQELLVARADEAD